MKNILTRLLASALCALVLTLPAAALKPGDPMGWVLHSDIVAYIDGFPIRSYNIGGATYIIAEELTKYGFQVDWLPLEEKLVIDLSHDSPDSYTADYTPKPSAYPAGTRAMPFLFTKITVWIGNRQVAGFNIGGNMCIRMDDLAEVFASEYLWDADALALRMTTKKKTHAWHHTYVTEGYDKDTAVDGEYAIWEFTKNEAGEFELTSTEGDVLFTPQISFGGDAMSYTIHLTEKTMYNQFYSAPHSLLVHREAGQFLRNSYNGFWGSLTTPDGREVLPDLFPQYAADEPALADYLRSQCDKLRQGMRVWYNGEQLDLIGLIDPGEYANTPGSRHLTWRTFTLKYSQTYALEDVDTVRIEFRLPDDFALIPDETMTVSGMQKLIREIADAKTGIYIGHRFTLTLEGTDVQLQFVVDESSRPCLTRISAMGNTLTLFKPMSLIGDFDWSMMQMNGIVFFNRLTYGVGDNFLFWDGGMHTWQDVPGQSDPTCYLYMNTAGQLAYCRRAGKYGSASIAAEGFGAVAKTITARDDFFDEIGTVALVDGNPVFTPTMRRSVADAYDLDAEYAKLRQSDPSLPETLDALIEQNLQRLHREALS